MSFTFNELNNMARRGTPFQRRMSKPEAGYRNIMEIKCPPKRARYTVHFKIHVVKKQITEKVYVSSVSKKGAEEKAIKYLLENNKDVHPSRFVLLGSRESDDLESFFMEYI